ncbi:DinB family protein [Aquimarina sediminis]|uniref:DinB family protein n=1 Tax=Aquimarina sediminis TaxID=2070536 RepID=UPI000CA056B7|nr:DinB family protein [Aquimarina sediminis]
MITDIGILTKYNLWANQRIVDWLLSNEENKLDESCNSSFPTIRLTINHILEAQILYLSILKQIPFSKNYDSTAIKTIKILIEQSQEFSDYSSQLEMKELNDFRSVGFKFLSGTFTQAQLIQHCMNHSTYHRGQIITMGHQLELTKAPSTDLLFYFNKVEKTNHIAKTSKSNS